MRISDWSSDVCSSDLARSIAAARDAIGEGEGNADGDPFSPPWKGGVGGGSILAKVSRAATHPQPLPSREGGQMCPSFGQPSPRFRSEERRVGKECVITVSSRLSPCH